VEKSGERAKTEIELMAAYVVPYALYIVGMQLLPSDPHLYAWAYPVMVLVIGAVTVGLLRGRQIFRPHRDVLAGVLVGLVGIALWIGLCKLDLEKHLTAHLPSWLQSNRTAFNPFDKIAHPAGVWGFIAMRLIGLVLLVPVAEELFCRGFLMRWLISPDWEKQNLGEFTWPSFAGVTLLFTLAHPEWVAAAVYCSLLNGLMYWKRDLWNCIVAHGVSNLVLGIYILTTEEWQLW
jgi:CAAX prenyl protease-like protein